MLAVATSARAPIAILANEDTLSRGLRTPPLPTTHAPVGDCWQNSRCHHLLMEERHTSRDTLVSHANDQAHLRPPLGAAVRCSVSFGGDRSYQLGAMPLTASMSPPALPFPLSS